MRKRIFIFAIAACVFLTACGKTAAGDMPFSENGELSGEASGSPILSETPEISTELPATPDPNTSAHECYIQAMRDENRYLNHVKANGRFANKYTFYDIDQNGIDELIISGGYINYIICSYEKGEVVDVAANKYGGKLKIYPEEGMVSWTGGHMDHYYEEYLTISGAKAKKTASKSWHVKLTEDSETIDKCTYKVKGDKVKEAEYEVFRASLKTEHVQTSKQLEWYRD